MSCFPSAAPGNLNSQCPGWFSWLLPCEASHYPFCLCGVLRLTLCRMARRVLYSEQEQVQLWFRRTGEETNTQHAFSCFQESRVPAALRCGRQDEGQTHPEPQLQTMITATALSQEEEQNLLGGWWLFSNHFTVVNKWDTAAASQITILSKTFFISIIMFKNWKPARPGGEVKPKVTTTEKRSRALNQQPINYRTDRYYCRSEIFMLILILTAYKKSICWFSGDFKGELFSKIHFLHVFVLSFASKSKC